MAYQVYAGTIPDKTDGTWTLGNKTLIYDTANDGTMSRLVNMDVQNAPLILDPTLTQEKNQIGEFTFTIPKLLEDPVANGMERQNPLWSSVTENKTVVAIYQDGTLYWIGYVREVQLNFDLSKYVVVEDVLGFLKWDSAFIRPKTYYVTVPNGNLNDGTSLWLNANFCLLQYAHDHSSSLNPPPFEKGTVDVQKGVTKDFSQNGTDVSTCWDAINTHWLDEYDGYFRPRYVEDNAGKITFYLDYTVDISAKTTQTVEYGVNMLDLEIDRRTPDDLVNYVYSSNENTTTKGWWIFKTTSSSIVYGEALDAASIKKYGVHARRIVSDSTTESGLNNDCKKALATYKQDIEPTITVKAFDLCDAGAETDHLGFLKKTRIISKPHGIDEWMVCTKEVLPLDKPDQKEFTFGRPPEKLTKQQNKNTTAAQQAKVTLRGLVSHAQG